jgi:FkbM family methyltransferase
MHLISAFTYGLGQKVYAPLRKWKWRRKRSPFIFHGKRGAVFLLEPNQYIDEEIYTHGIYEYRLLELLVKHVRGRVFIDVGANIGNHALFLADNFERVICFEPSQPVALRLRRNIALSGKTQVEVNEIGLGDVNQEILFYPNNSGNMGRGSFVAATGSTPCTLPVRIGDEVLRDVAGVALLKIDVEGFERAVFAGLRQLISRERPMIVFEFDGRDNRNSEWAEIVSALPEYHLAELRGIGGRGLSRLLSAYRNGVATRLVRFEEPEPRFYETILAFPSKEAAAIFGVSGPSGGP